MNTRDHKPLQSAIDRYLSQTFELTDLPGLAVGVRTTAGFDYEKALGYSDYPRRTPLRTEAVFHMASVAKLFVATAAEILRVAGQIHPDDRLSDRLPGFVMADERYRKITLRHVLSHTAGIPDIEDYGWTRPETDKGALHRFALSEEVRNRPLLWDPGEGRFQYSNIGFDILGAVLAQVSGQSFEDFMSRCFFQPLGMRNTSFLSFLRTQAGRTAAADPAGVVDPTETADPGRPDIPPSLQIESFDPDRCALPHFKAENRDIERQSYYPYSRAHAPSSTLTATLADMKKWGDVHLAAFQPEQGGHPILSRDSYETMWTPVTEVPDNGEQIGLGWFIRNQRGHRLYGHEGSDEGFRSSFWICPQQGIQITVLSNITRAPVKKINKGIFDLLTG